MVRNLHFYTLHVLNRSEEHTSELQSQSISYAVFCLKKKIKHYNEHHMANILITRSSQHIRMDHLHIKRIHPYTSSRSRSVSTRPVSSFHPCIDVTHGISSEHVAHARTEALVDR